MRKTISLKDYCLENGFKKKDVWAKLLKSKWAKTHRYGCGTGKVKVVPIEEAKNNGIAWSKGCASGSIGSRTWFWNKKFLDDIMFDLEPNIIFKCGKYSGEKVSDVYKTDPAYAEWSMGKGITKNIES